MLNEIKTLIVPAKTEVILYGAFALFLLVAQNISRYWSYFSGVKFDELKNANNASMAINDWVFGLEARIDPRIADFFVWMLLGMVAISVVLFVQSNLRSAKEEHDLLENMRNPKTKTHELEVFLLRLATRIAAGIAILVYLRIFLGEINVSLTKLFFTSSLTLNDVASWLWLVISIVLMAIALYFFAVLARVLFLKTRVF